MNNSNNSSLLKVIDELSEVEKLDLFKVEELEVRLEMTKAVSRTAVQVKVDGACHNTANGVCW